VVILRDIAENERAVSMLEEAMARDRLAHAYLLSGPPGAPLVTAARALAAAANCETQPGVGCTDCGQCVRIFEDRHPDVVLLRPEGAAKIVPIDTIREQVVPALALCPHEARTRWFIFEEAAALQDPAANALLKSLEEPPARTHFILCTNAPDAILPTIRSRCQKLLFKAAAVADGEDAAVIADALDRLEGALKKNNLADVLEVASFVSQQKDHVAAILAALANRFREQAVAAARAHNLLLARFKSACAEKTLAAENEVVLHNVAKQLAIESLLIELRRLPDARSALG
jgi:DNA polymerase-3 subunit delta'